MSKKKGKTQICICNFFFIEMYVYLSHCQQEDDIKRFKSKWASGFLFTSAILLENTFYI